MAAQPTPKFKSAEFKATLAEVKAIFDAHSMGIVLLDALERKSAEQIFQKFAKQGGARIGSVSKLELVGPITGWFFDLEEAAYQVMHQLDRACQKERHIVASIPEEQAPERVGSYRAISLKRERAKFVWALSRDDRASVRSLASRIINEFFQEVADLELARAVARGEEAPGTLTEDVELARRLQGQAERLSEVNNQVSVLERQVTTFEGDRARLLAEIGAKERHLKQATEAREDLEHQLTALKGSLGQMEDRQREAEAARAAEREARAIAEELAQKVRRLEKLAGAAEGIERLQGELEEAQRRNEELARQSARTEQAQKRERGDLEKERSRLRNELEESREELKRVRRRVAELEESARAQPIAPRAESAVPGQERVVILLDQANLGTIAAHTYGKKVNYSALLDQLRLGRPLAKAVAFVVDNGGTAFDAFCDTLRKSGWELRIKRPKKFADGRSKADWDMGIAMEAIEMSQRAETAVLVSGDGDFAPLVKQLQRWGQRVEVAAFSEGLAAELKNVADRLVRLDETSFE